MSFKGRTLRESFAAAWYGADMGPVSSKTEIVSALSKHEQSTIVYLLELKVTAIEMTRKVAGPAEDLITPRPSACTKLMAVRKKTE